MNRISSPVGKHWVTYDQLNEGIKLTEDEKKRLAKGEVIPINDPTAICTKEGWEIYEKRRRILNQEVKWIFDFNGTELEVWARTKEDAIFTFKQYGIIAIDIDRIRQAPESPQDVLPGGGID